LEDDLLSVEDIDFEFENTPVKVVAIRSHPEVKVAGQTIGPLEEGREFQVKYWIARELVKNGIARFHDEEQIDLIGLHKLYWRETVQTGRQLSPLPDNFYPKLRRFIMDLKEKSASDPVKAQEYDKVLRLAQDIVSCRLKKVINLAVGPAQTDNVLSSLSPEEKLVYNYVYDFASKWRAKILKFEGVPK
jgi:hypothetical protein